MQQAHPGCPRAMQLLIHQPAVLVRQHNAPLICYSATVYLARHRCIGRTHASPRDAKHVSTSARQTKCVSLRRSILRCHSMLLRIMEDH